MNSCNLQIIKRAEKIRAVIFDMDGTLLDTEVLYSKFWIEAARYSGFAFELKHALMLRSIDTRLGNELMQKEFGPEFDIYSIRELRKKMMEKYIEENGINTKPGMKECIKRLKKAGYKIGLATTSPEERARRYLGFFDCWDVFDAKATGDMVARRKPEPDLYVEAVRQLNLEAAECAAVEDSPAGIRSALNAGCFPILIPDWDPPSEETISISAMVMSSLSEIADFFEHNVQWRDESRRC